MPNLGFPSLLQACRSVISRTVKPTGNIETVSRRVNTTLLEDAVHLQRLLAPSWGHCMRLAGRLGERLNERIVVLSGVFARQFSAIAAQRLRRAVQIVVLYNNLGYDRHLIKTVVARMGSGFIRRLRNRPFYLVLGAALFTWDENRITETELSNVADEIMHIRRDENGEWLTNHRLDEWEKVIDKGHIAAWRKPVENSYLYEYKVCGSYKDLPARAFFAAQTDLEFRKQWDKLVISLDVVDTEEETGTEVVQWITHFPYPMYSREYLYIRRVKVDVEKKLMIIVNRSVDHPRHPITNKYIRVDTYVSKMVIKPHTTFDENGFDYVLTYFDDPKSAFPSVAYNWMANTGVPDFVDKVHTAAVLLHEKKKKILQEATEESGVTVPM